MNPHSKTLESNTRREFIEGRDYYFENGLMVLTAHFLRERGYCCRNNCRNCPYLESANGDSKQVVS